MELRPEMMSYAFNVHDEYFQPIRHTQPMSCILSTPGTARGLLPCRPSGRCEA